MEHADKAVQLSPLSFVPSGSSIGAGVGAELDTAGAVELTDGKGGQPLTEQSQAEPLASEVPTTGRHSTGSSSTST